jgi:hypothetical protein
MTDWLGEIKPVTPNIESFRLSDKGAHAILVGSRRDGNRWKKGEISESLLEHSLTSEKAVELHKQYTESRHKAAQEGLMAGVNAVIDKAVEENGKLKIKIGTPLQAYSVIVQKFTELYMESKDLRYMSNSLLALSKVTGMHVEAEPDARKQSGMTLEDSNVIFQIFNNSDKPMSPQDVIDANFR